VYRDPPLRTHVVQVADVVEQLRVQLAAVAPPRADRAVRHGGGVGDLHQLGLAELLGEIAHQEDRGLVGEEQHPAARVVLAQLTQQGTQAQQDVGPRLSAGRAVVELAEAGAAGVLAGQPGLHAAAGQQVEHAQLTVAQPLVDGERHPAALQRELRGLPGPQVRRHDGDLRPLVLRQPGQPLADRAGLLAAQLGQGNVGVALRDVDGLEPAGLGVLGDDVAGALAVAHHAQPLQLLHGGLITQRSGPYAAPAPVPRISAPIPSGRYGRHR
jgi:hypothetical protein